MKKLFILVAIFAIPTIIFCQTRPQDLLPVMHDMRLNEMKAATVAPFSSIDNVSLTKKGVSVFQAHRDSGEVYTPLISAGQIYEMGGSNNYNVAYDPYSKYVFGISTSRYSVAGTNDSIKKVGEIFYFRYQKHKYGYTADSMFMRELYNVTEATPQFTDKIRHEWRTPTVVVGNSTKSSDISGVKVVVSAQMDEFAITSTESKPAFNTLWWVNGNKLHDVASYQQAISTIDISEPWVNGLANYSFNEYVKGHVAYFDEIPYALFFGPLHHQVSPQVNPIRFGFVASCLDNIPDVGGVAGEAMISKFQILPQKINDIFGQTMIPSDSNYLRWFNLDNDNNGNLYFGFFETPAHHATNTNYTDGMRKAIKLPAVVKTPFVSNDADVITSEAVVDTMPISVLIDYILDNGGIFDPNAGSDDPIPGMFYPYIGGINNDLPFIVSSEDNYHLLTPLFFYTSIEAGNLTWSIQLVEMTKTAGNWKINKVSDFEDYIRATYDTNYAYLKADNGYFMNDAPGPENLDGDSLQLLWWSARWGDYIGGPGVGLQVSKTFDGKHLIAKWQECGSKDYVKMPRTMKFRIQDSIEVETDTLWSPSLMLSYRSVHPDSTWSTPIRASHLNFHENPQDFNADKDTIQPWGTYMPRIVPSIDEVIMSYSYGIVQDSAQKAMPVAQARHRYLSYRYTGIIVPSAKTGPNEDIPVGIEEGIPALTNELEAVYPNPASNTASFKFKLLKPNHVKLTVTNMLGQEVAVLADQYCNASEYTISDYDVSRLPIGTYYLTLTSGSVVKTKMFTIAR